MKKSYLVVLLLFIGCPLYSQFCNPVDADSFREIHKRIKKYKTDNGKLEGSENFLLGQCLTSSQLYHLAVLLDGDAERGLFIKKYFHLISDIKSVATVFDSFDQMSNALNTYEELRPKILAQSTLSPPTALNDQTFAEKLEVIHLENYDRDKQSRIRVLFEDDYLTLGQVEILINEFDSTRDKLWAVKFLYSKCVDKDSYFKLAKMFEYHRDRDSVLALID